jgi:hypothetical protein
MNCNKFWMKRVWNLCVPLRSLRLCGENLTAETQRAQRYAELDEKTYLR